MRTAPFTDYDVKQLLEAKKFISKKVRDNTNKANAAWTEVEYNICRLDRPDQDLRLRFNARLTKAITVTIPQPLPSASLLWHQIRIRGIDYKLSHDDIQNGVKVGEINGWHEHQWNSIDHDSKVISVNDEIKKFRISFKSLVRFCLQRWRIEFEEYQEKQGTLFDLPE